MVNIEELKAKHAKEMRCALLENEAEKRLILSRFSVVDESLTQKGKMQCSIRGKELLSNITKEGLKEALKVFPVTEKLSVHIGDRKYVQLKYRLQLHKYPSDRDTMLNIEWISGDLDISTEIEVGLLEGLEEFFKDTTRHISESERSSFGLIRWNRNMLNNFRFKTFSCGNVVCFQGGYHVMKSESFINDLIGTILR